MSTIPTNAATRAVKRIIRDISDRRGLGDEWDGLDDQLQAEISNVWTAIVAEEIRLIVHGVTPATPSEEKQL